MRIALLVSGGRAEVLPFVGLARGLMRAGHEVRLACGAPGASLAVRHAVPVIPLRDRVPRLTGPRRGIGWSTTPSLPAPRAAIPPARRLLAGAWRLIAPSDLVVYHSALRAAALIAERFGVPAIAASTQPPGALGVARDLQAPRRGPRLLAGARGIAPHGKRGTGRAGAWGALARLAGAERRAARRRVAGWGQGPPVLYAMSRHLVDPARWLPRGAVTGCWFPDPPDAWRPPQALARFLAAGPEPIYVDLGDTGAVDADRAALIVIDAIARAGARGVIARGACSLVPGVSRLPGHVLLVEDVPADWMIARTSLAVIPGEGGIAAAALRAGRPMVVCPFTRAQRFWARALEARGVAAASPLEAHAIARAVTRAANDDLMRARARALGVRIRQEDGVRRAVTLLERAIAKEAPPARDP